MPPLALPHADSPVALAEAPTQDDRLAIRKYQVPFIELPTGSVETREKELLARLHGKRFTFMELSHHLTNWELDLLSQMIRDNIIPAVFDKTSIHFRHPKRKKSTEMPLAATAFMVTKHEEVER